ncbi:MAG TPA: XdhC family protein [Desulfomonilaceae bacterium]|nr:XdhC family protein [Desulfomonilaceae bacterium]
MLAIWNTAVEQFEKHQDFVLATIVAVRGSSPRHVGTRFLVKRDGGIIGTIGGGLFEARVQQFAAAALESGTSHFESFSFTGQDAQSADMICGGDAEVLVEFVNNDDQVFEEICRNLVKTTKNRASGHLFTEISVPVGGWSRNRTRHLFLGDPGFRIGGFPHDDRAVRAMPDARLLKPAQALQVEGLEHPVLLEWLHPTGIAYIFGAGHVGACVAHVASYVNFKVVVVDDREEFASPERVSEADEIVVTDFHECFSHLTVDEDSYIIIVTRGHAHDKTVLAQALKTSAGYVGMIGSRRKTKLIFESLLMEGFTRQDLERVHAPIGLPIGGETPQEIAVSIVAELIEVRSRKDRLKQLG